MDNEPKDNLEPDRGTSPPECKHCKATKNKKGDPWSPMGLLAHQDRHCTQNPARNPAQNPTKNPAQKNEPSFCAGSSTNSTQDPQDAAPTSLSLIERSERQQPTSASAVTQKDEESVTALWEEYRYDRITKTDENGRKTSRPVFSPGDHYFMGVPYHLASKKVRAQRAGVIGKLRAYVHGVRAEEKEDQAAISKNQASTMKQKEKEAAEKQRRIDNGEWWLALTKEEMTVHDTEFWAESARLVAKLPEGEPVEPDEFSPFVKPKITHEDLAARVAEEFLRRLEKKGKVNDHRKPSRR